MKVCGVSILARKSGTGYSVPSVAILIKARSCLSRVDRVASLKNSCKRLILKHPPQRKPGTVLAGQKSLAFLGMLLKIAWGLSPGLPRPQSSFSRPRSQPLRCAK